jgi:CubicO group peptidase (beta-lactamase class C family)
MSRRRIVGTSAITIALSLGISAVWLNARPTPAVPSQSSQASAIATIVQNAMKTEHLRAVIVKVTQGDKVVISQAFGESINGVPATTAMHFRNGAVAFAYLGTLLMEFVDEHKVKLDDTIERWMPELPEATKVTLKMLANQTSGYPDFETDPKWLAAWTADPFHIWTYEERLKYAFSRSMMFEPGTNWNYAHTNFMILGEILSKIGGKPLDVLLKEKVFVPMGLKNTTASQTSEIPSPILHAFDSERRTALKIPADVAFTEESTFFNPQWGTPIGANETTTIDDMATTAVKVGTGALISKSSYEAMTGPHLVGFGKTQDNCAPSCATQTNVYNYGLGIVRSGSWLLQNPLLGGYAAIEAYLPSKKIAIAVAVTFAPEAFDAQGNYTNSGDKLFRSIGAYMAPDDAPPLPPSAETSPSPESPKAARSVADPSIQSEIVAAVEKDRKHFGGNTPVPATLIGVWDAKGGSFIRAFGYADIEKKVPLTPTDHFRIGSNTKTFVISVLLQLVAEKKLSLDDPLSRFSLGVTIPNAEGITVRDLCNMRSGLFEAYDTPEFARLNMTVPKDFDPHTLVAWAMKQKPYFPPGKGYRYTNTNYLLLGMIIEEITKDSVGNQIRKRLLEPFGLTQTSYPQTEAMPSPWVRGYRLDKQGNWEDISNTIPVSFMGSAGAMISDMNDIRRWIELYATGKTIGPGSYQDLINCIPFLGNTFFGLGITCSAGWYGYTGALPGYNTADYYSPETGTTILAWINYQAKEPVEGVASVMVRDIARILTPEHVPFVYEASSKPSEP